MLHKYESNVGRLLVLCPTGLCEMKLHLGCGTKRLPGFVHVDIRPEVKPDIVASVTDLRIVKDNTVELIYFCHGLEHIPYAGVQAVLAEWRRVLKPGGILRLAMPDMEHMAGMLHNGEVGLRVIRYAISGGQDYPDNFHYSVWDWRTLKAELEQAHYKRVRYYDARSFLPSGYRDWSMIPIAGLPISLNVAADAP